MRIKFLGVACLVFCLLGCSSLKRENSKVKEIEATTLEYVSNDAVLTQRISVAKDSLDASFEIEIWPKGKFMFSADGFEGEATKLLIKGKVTKLRGSSLKQSTEIVEDKRVKETISKTLDATKLNKSRNATPYSLLIYLFVLLAIFLFCLWFRKKRLWFT